MKNTINWNHKNRKILEHMWSEGANDKQITEFFGCGAWAVAKQRSHMGLVKHKKQKGLKRAITTTAEKITKDWKIIAYIMDNTLHVTRIGRLVSSSLEEISHRMLNCNKEISEIVVLRPVLTITRHTTEEHI